MTCILCQTNAGRIDINNECCRVRYIAGLPGKQRQAVYDAVKEKEGEEAKKALTEKVNNEYQRRK